ncbi:hypothetical protein [Vibrio sp. HN007]|uniref:hypothetical protein n=1 Tax=Vibrio iocasae TaxID=3098914 RepID=UPI0035D46012
MKLIKRLYISNQEVGISTNMASLKLSNGGTAIFVIQVEQSPNALELVRFDIGYGEDMYTWLEGYIDKVQPAENGAYKITVKENAGILAKRWPLSLEHPTVADVIEQLESLTGLDFQLPDADYINKVIPNFVCSGTGYQCMQQIGKAFEIPDFVWYQNDDQSVYCGSYEHSRFHGKTPEVPLELTSRRNGDNMTFAPFPMIRPGHILNGNRIHRLDLIGDEMTAYWKPQNAEIPPKKRETLQNFPELAAGYHLPKFGRVEAVRDTAKAGQTSDPFRPRFAIDLQLLDENFKPDADVPVYRSIPLPVIMSGHESGFLSYPLEGTLVEVAFAYGRNDRPIIRNVYGRDYALPDIEPGEQLQQQRQEVSHRINAAGHTTEQTDQSHTSKAFQKLELADRYKAEFGQHHMIIDEHSIEEIVGKKLIEALGALDLLAGDDITLGSLGNIQTATAGDLIETIGKVRRSITTEHQWLQAPKTWVGSKQENVLILLSELMQVVKELADTLASHTHSGVLAGPATTAAPVQANAITEHGGDSNSLKERLDPMSSTG